jgi:hypothetical protein
VGDEALFTQGCPVCGYTAPPPSAGKSKTGASGQEWASAGALPWWIYLLAVLFFIGACGFLIAFL